MVDSLESLRDLFKFCANVAFRFAPFGLFWLFIPYNDKSQILLFTQNNARVGDFFEFVASKFI